MTKPIYHTAETAVCRIIGHVALRHSQIIRQRTDIFNNSIMPVRRRRYARRRRLIVEEFREVRKLVKNTSIRFYRYEIIAFAVVYLNRRFTRFVCLNLFTCKGKTFRPLPIFIIDERTIFVRDIYDIAHIQAHTVWQEEFVIQSRIQSVLRNNLICVNRIIGAIFLCEYPTQSCRIAIFRRRPIGFRQFGELYNTTFRINFSRCRQTVYP